MVAFIQAYKLSDGTHSENASKVSQWKQTLDSCGRAPFWVRTGLQVVRIACFPQISLVFSLALVS